MKIVEQKINNKGKKRNKIEHKHNAKENKNKTNNQGESVLCTQIMVKKAHFLIMIHGHRIFFKKVQKKTKNSIHFLFVSEFFFCSFAFISKIKAECIRVYVNIKQYSCFCCFVASLNFFSYFISDSIIKKKKLQRQNIAIIIMKRKSPTENG